MGYRKYKGDPYWTRARFQSTCHKCKATIRTGEDIFYYPNGRSVFCKNERCGGEASRDFESLAFDEAAYCGELY